MNNNSEFGQGLKKAGGFNADSPSFTPSTMQSGGKKSTFSSQAASAAPFTPRGVAGAPSTSEPETVAFNPAANFVPSNNYEVAPNNVATNGVSSESNISYDPYTIPSINQGLAATPAAAYNPYAEDHSSIAASSGNFYGTQSAYTAPLQPTPYHLYSTAASSRRDDLMPYQRHTSDFFMNDKLRERVQRKLEAAQQTMPNSQLPDIDQYHSLVALDTNHRKSASIFGFPSWVYKAVSSKNGHGYCLRRLAGFRLSNENAIRSVKEWRKVHNSNVVHVHDAFTTRAFGDSSIVFVQDYHPLSKTLLETHFTQNTPNHGNRFQSKAPVAEAVLWAYTVQIANALKAIHSIGLVARCIDLSKIIVTDPNKIRLNACAILDVVQYDAQPRIQELQQQDFQQFGQVMLCLATNTLPNYLGINFQGAMEQLSKSSYSPEFRDTVTWLLSPAKPGMSKNILDFIRGISAHVMDAWDGAGHAIDRETKELSKAVENGRCFRLLCKLGAINERGELDGDPNWSENGERYPLKLFRDYVFHQVDANGKPVIDPGHMIRCLNKLDAGIDEKIAMTSRDNQTVFIVTYKELKKLLGNAYADLTKGSPMARNF